MKPETLAAVVAVLFAVWLYFVRVGEMPIP
jgi:hypothetical protein